MRAKIMRSLLRISKQCCSVLLINRVTSESSRVGQWRLMSAVYELGVPGIDRNKQTVQSRGGQVDDPRVSLSCGSLRNVNLISPVFPQKALNVCANTECNSSDRPRVSGTISTISPK